MILKVSLFCVMNIFECHWNTYMLQFHHSFNINYSIFEGLKIQKSMRMQFPSGILFEFIY